LAWPKAGAAVCAWSCANNSEQRSELLEGVPRLSTSFFPTGSFLHTAANQQVEWLPPADRIPRVQSTSFSVTIRHTGAVSLLDVSGRLTSFETGALRDSISRLLKEGRKNIVLNLSGLQYLDSSGIGELARIYVSVVKRSGEMKVIGLSSKIEEVLKITQLYQVFPEFPSEEAALESFPKSGR
jgi:anti-sigma B factor antagonist